MAWAFQYHFLRFLIGQYFFHLWCVPIQFNHPRRLSHCAFSPSFLQSDRADLISQIKALRDDNRQIRTIVDEKIKEIEPLQQALGKLRNANSANRGVCSSEEELNTLVRLNPSSHN